MRTLFVTACLCLDSGWVITARAQPAALARTASVTVDVTVLDRGGRPMTGLGAADFSVELDGRGRQILAITYLPAGAPMTGGVGPVFDAVSPVTAPVYRIVVEPPGDTPPGAAFAVSVVVKRPGTKVIVEPRVRASPASGRAARPAAAAAAAPGETSIEERLRSAIATGRAQSGLSIELGSALRRASDPAQLSLDVQIEIPASARAPLTTLLGVVDAGGAIRSAPKTIDASPGGGAYRLDFSLPLAPGAYKLRFAAADASGAIGALETSVRAALAPMGPLLASDLLRWTAGASRQAQPLLLEAVPPDAMTLGAALELYLTGGATTTPSDLLVKISLGPAEGAQSASIERVVAPEARDGMLVAEAEFPLDRVTSGRHVLRAAVLSGTTVLGTASATITRR